MAHQVEKRKVCRCEHCGNEAEMVLACSLDDGEAVSAEPTVPSGRSAEIPRQVKAKGTCSHCGNEAEMWIDV